MGVQRRAEDQDEGALAMMTQLRRSHQSHCCSRRDINPTSATTLRMLQDPFHGGDFIFNHVTEAFPHLHLMGVLCIGSWLLWERIGSLLSFVFFHHYFILFIFHFAKST